MSDLQTKQNPSRVGRPKLSESEKLIRRIKREKLEVERLRVMCRVEAVSEQLEPGSNVRKMGKSPKKMRISLKHSASCF